MLPVYGTTVQQPIAMRCTAANSSAVSPFPPSPSPRDGGQRAFSFLGGLWSPPLRPLRDFERAGPVVPVSQVFQVQHTLEAFTYQGELSSLLCAVFVFCFCALAGSAVPALVSLPSSLGTLLCAVWFCALAGSAVRRNKYSSSQCCSSLLYLAPPPPAPPLPMKILVLGLFCGRPAANQHVFKTECSFKTEKDGRNSSRLPPRLLYPSTTRMQNRWRINTVAIRHRYSHLRRAFTAWCSDRQSQFTTLQTHDFVNRLGTVHAERNFAGNKVPSRSNEALHIRKRKP